MSDQPQVNELVSLLSRYGEKELSGLREEYPELRPLLKPGLILGQPSGGNQSALLDVAVAGLNAAIIAASDRLPRLRENLRKTSRLNLIGQVASALGSATTLGVIAFSAEQQGVAAIAASFALLGSLSALWAKHRLRDVAGNEGGLTKIYLSLRENYWEARELLALLAHPRLATSDSTELINRANTLARSMNLLLDEI